MEGLKQGLRAFSKEPISTTSNRASFGESTIYADQSRVLVPRASGDRKSFRRT
uniref:Uncharacterized protein n=1 Tax=Nelumbo nucifera TaxID=4432 RepID=A0A822ZI14_NELNU|nr:TPA_asm: hypothetical protein HUJ06_002410 [Nelumbo nucifera]